MSAPRLLSHERTIEITSPRTVWFIRHAESESNAGLPTIYPASPQLTPRGITQAEHLATTFQMSPDLIVTSSYTRTQQTAIPLRARFPEVPHEEWPVHEFSYLSLGHKRATSPSERWPLVEIYWGRNDPEYCDGPGAETFAELVARAVRVMERLRTREENFIAIVSHGLFMRAVLWVLLTGAEISPDRMRRFRSFFIGCPIPNTAILKLNVDEEIWTNGISTQHLSDENVFDHTEA